jgi:hypothetical protein
MYIYSGQTVGWLQYPSIAPWLPDISMLSLEIGSSKINQRLA